MGMTMLIAITIGFLKNRLKSLSSTAKKRVMSFHSILDFGFRIWDLKSAIQNRKSEIILSSSPLARHACAYEEAHLFCLFFPDRSAGKVNKHIFKGLLF